MTELSTQQLLAAKALATEVAVLALLREKRDDTAFWNSMDKLMQIILNLENLARSPDPAVRAQADAAQTFLDSWRGIAGKPHTDPAPPESGPLDPPQAGSR